MADMDRINRSPNSIKSIAALKELVGLWRNGGETVTIPEVAAGLETGLAVWVLAEHSVALTESIVLLAEKGMFLQLAPLIRLTIECGVTAAWLSVAPNAEKSASYEEARQRRAYLENLIREKSTGLDEVLSRVRDEIEGLAEHESEAGRKFEERCKSIVGGEKLYIPYRALSAVSHAELSLTEQYLHEDVLATDPHLRYSLLSPAKYALADQAFATQVVSLVLALKAWDNLEDGNPRSVRLAHVASHFGFQADIKWVGETK